MRGPEVRERPVRSGRRSRRESGAVATQHECDVAADQPYGCLDNGVEYGLHVGRRLTYYAQDFRRRGLALQRLAEIPRFCLDFVEQPRVLDRDQRLIGEGLDELDLTRREWFGLGSGEA